MRADYPTPEQTDGLRALWKEAFGDSDEFLDGYFDTAYATDRCRCITENGRIAAALYWMDCRCDGAPMAYLYAVATARLYRGQGLCRRLMEDTHSHLKNLGYAGCILVPGEPELFAMYEKMGYAAFGGMDTVTVEAGSPLPLQTVTAEEYAALRRQYLPPRGVTQEGMAFLATYANLYAGDDFVCAWAGDTALELLGNTAAAPGILGALGKTKGRFRLPGKHPFAMYRPLSDTPAPAYFGIAFD